MRKYLTSRSKGNEFFLYPFRRWHVKPTALGRYFKPFKAADRLLLVVILPSRKLNIVAVDNFCVMLISKLCVKELFSERSYVARCQSEHRAAALPALVKTHAFKSACVIFHIPKCS